MLFNILTITSLLIILLMFRRLVGVCPSLLACLIRGKESINLEASVQLSIDRDLLASSMIIPFCLTVWKFELYTPSFMSDCNENICFLIIFGALIALITMRKLLEWIVKPHKISTKTYKTAGKAARTFFSLLTLILLGVGWIMSFTGTPDETIKSAMLWISAAIYLIFIIRKTQILTSSASFFAGFLYLCALEIFPTGILVVPALIF